LLPVEVPLIDDADAIGKRVAKELEASGLSAVFLASSDLTHYGPSYRFTPAGVGMSGLEWAKENDCRVLSLVTDMQVDRIVPEVQTRSTALAAAGRSRRCSQPVVNAAQLGPGAASREQLRDARGRRAAAAR
jgi:AmmeMemoRadiSam system protein B